MAADPYKYFRIEARELVDGLSQGVLALEKQGYDAETVARLLRLAHTLKGAARVVRRPEIAASAHRLEEEMAPLRATGTAPSHADVESLLALVDRLASEIAALDEAPAKEAARPPEAPTPIREAPRTTSAEAEDRDAVLEGVAEVHALALSLRRDLAELARGRHVLEVLERHGDARRRGGGPSSDAPTARGKALMHELSHLFAHVEQRSASVMDQIDRELQQVRTAAERLRLAPVGTIFTALERLSRDVAQATDKRVTFHGVGADVRLDSDVLTTVHAALVQLVGNAVAHGIESETERRRAGKTPDGAVRVEVARRGRNVAIRCEDDGGGVDVDALRAAARKRGLSTAHAQARSHDELLRLLFESGVSTAEVVTHVSGRGVGLDIVREAAQRLGGTVSVHTERGRGTTIELVVPVSVASLTGLLVHAEPWSVTIPLDGIRRAVRLADTDIAHTADGDSIVYDGNVVPFVPLARVLTGERATPQGPRGWSAVIVQSKSGLAAIGVDRLLGASDVVIRPLPALAPTAAVVAGAFADANGDLRLALDPDALVDAVRRVGATAPAHRAPRAPILVVDDSLTTRMLERSILEAAGYQVDLAVSGEEGLEKARANRYAIILVDVEMPGMNGFEFIERIRADPGLRGVPALLVTSRASPDDRRRGEEVGAQGHIAKGEFDQTRFLDRIRELVGS
jgi:two-component system, chemotaxis family, sensor kinase CheA